MSESSNTADFVDLRNLVTAERHAKLPKLVNALEPAASFILVNDYDRASFGATAHRRWLLRGEAIGRVLAKAFGHHAASQRR